LQKENEKEKRSAFAVAVAKLFAAFGGVAK
jgi:hypothetical protein